MSSTIVSPFAVTDDTRRRRGGSTEPFFYKRVEDKSLPGRGHHATTRRRRTWREITSTSTISRARSWPALVGERRGPSTPRTPPSTKVSEASSRLPVHAFESPSRIALLRPGEAGSRPCTSQFPRSDSIFAAIRTFFPSESRQPLALAAVTAALWKAREAEWASLWYS